MGATRKETTSNAEYARHQAYYQRNKAKILAKGKQRYQEQRQFLLKHMSEAREHLRQQRLYVKRQAAYAASGKPHPTLSTIKARHRAQTYVQTEKTNKHCLDCGVLYPPYVLDFDHVRGTKRDDISTLVHKGRSLRVLSSEIAKCDLICANCHRVRTHRRKISADSRVTKSAE